MIAKVKKLVWESFFRLHVWMEIEGEASTMELLMLTKASTRGSMWATLTPNPHDFNTHSNWINECILALSHPTYKNSSRCLGRFLAIMGQNLNVFQVQLVTCCDLPSFSLLI